MNTCPKCNTELSQQDVFCYVCGHKIEKQTKQHSNTNEVFSSLPPCANCGAIPTSVDDIFCAECGSKLIRPKDEPESSQDIPKPEAITSDAQVAENKTDYQDKASDDSIIKSTSKDSNLAEDNNLQQMIPPLSNDKQDVVQQQAKEEPVQKVIQSSPIVQSQQQPVSSQSNNTSVPIVTNRKKSAGKIIFTILLILLIIVVVAGGIGGFMIYNGNISRETAGKYLPQSLIDMVPSAKGSSTTATRYYVVHCFGQFESKVKTKGKKTGIEKRAVISDVFTNLDITSETDDAAEIAFRNAGNSQIEKFSQFTKFFVVSFSSNSQALDERERIIKDLKSKGYKPEFVSVKK